MLRRHWSLVIFLLGSALCASAKSMLQLLLGRGISGVGGAGITTVSRIIISDVRSLDDNSVQAAVIVTLQGLGFIVGPLIGGSISGIGKSGGEGWRWIFIMSCPLTVVSIILLWALMREGLVGPQNAITEGHSDDLEDHSPLTVMQKLARVDWLGAIVLITGSILVLYGLSQGPSSSTSSSWTSPSVVSALVTGSAATTAFPVCEWLLRTNAAYPLTSSSPNQPFLVKLKKLWIHYTTDIHPMIPIELFKSSSVWITYLNALTGGMLLFSCLYFLSTYFVIVAGYGPTKSGVQLLYLAPGMGESPLKSCLQSQPTTIFFRGWNMCRDPHGQVPPPGTPL